MLQMKSLQAPSIQSRLVLLVLACIFPASLMAVILISYDYQMTRDDFIHSAMATARANAMEIDSEFAIVQSALLALSTSPSFNTGDIKSIDAQARMLSAQQNIFNIVLEDASGQQLMNTFRPYGAALPHYATGPALKHIVENDATAISGLFVGPLSQRQIVSVGIPVRMGKAIPCALTATVSADRFQAMMRTQNYPAYWITSLLDSNGTVVARSHDIERFRGTRAIPEVLKRLKEQPNGAFETRTLDGKPILAVLAQAGNSKWTVAIGIPLDKLSAEMDRKLWSLMLATVGVLGSGLFFAWKIGTRIRRSLHGLIRPALALGAGERVEPAAYGLREADEVAEALVRASTMLLQAKHAATHDVLTGIANRAMFCDFLERQLALAHRNKTPLSVLYLDLDNFKIINDTHGHAVGDELLMAATRRLTAQLRKSDMAARLGGDEFAVVLGDADESETVAVVDKLSKSMAEPYHIDGLNLLAGASIGVAMFPQSGTSVSSLLEVADQAMYIAKSDRKRASRH
jgi:diguanylate cyclase (GGDEF)-like protein